MQCTLQNKKNLSQICKKKKKTVGNQSTLQNKLMAADKNGPFLPR
jgi:hypothetical protein